MIEKPTNLQLELFKQPDVSAEGNRRSPGNAFLAHIWNYEKTILIIIAMVITGIVSFSMGVEKGKRLTMQIPAQDKARAVAITPSPQRTPAAIKSQEAVKENISPDKENYIIRLASYRVKTHAQSEAELLKKKGLFPLILSKGGYAVLCVGNISDKQTARSLLAQLKKRYRDCYITRL